MESIDKLRKYAVVHWEPWDASRERLNESLDEIEQEIAKLQESWAQEAREHVDDSARLAELIHENSELKREIAERYIELPVDADGVPIRVGDELYNGEVIAFGGLAEGGVVFVHRGFEDGNYILEAFASNVTHHVKTHTIEDVLRDCCNEWNEHCGDDWESSVYAKYAEEIRGMMA